jgi:DNA-binding MarR family transcriptional regulator
MAQALLTEYRVRAELGVGLRLLDHANGKTGRCDPAYSEIAHALGYDRQTVIRAAQQLEKDGSITIKRKTQSARGMCRTISPSTGSSRGKVGRRCEP